MAMGQLKKIYNLNTYHNYLYHLAIQYWPSRTSIGFHHNIPESQDLWMSTSFSWHCLCNISILWSSSSSYSKIFYSHPWSHN